MDISIIDMYRFLTFFVDLIGIQIPKIFDLNFNILDLKKQ